MNVNTNTKSEKQESKSTASFAVAFDSVTKRFGEVLANDSISCEVSQGGIHSFLGENGAGKSTLMKILSGSYHPDAGSIILNGEPVAFRSASEALEAGIGMVYQHFTLASSMTVLDNILLGDCSSSFFVNRKLLKEQVDEKAKSFGFAFDLNMPVWKLSISECQKLEIFKLLWKDVRILILDEPTSQLAPFEAEDILSVMSHMAKNGRTVLMISHNIEDVLRFSSQVTVLRKGRCISTVNARTVNVSEVASMMIGELPSRKLKSGKARSTSSIAQLKNIAIRPSTEKRKLDNINLELYPGEVLGIAGVAGSGQYELAKILTGHLKPDQGTLHINGEITSMRTWKSSERITAHIPTDPVNKGSIQSLSLMNNLFIHDVLQQRFCNGPFLDLSKMRDESRNRLNHFQVQPSDPDLPCSALSGGNLQRLIIARELACKSSLLVAVNPTSGLDFSATMSVREEILSHAHKENAVVLISPNLIELLSLSDRIMVLCAGEVVGIEKTEDLDSESLGLLMGGVNAGIVKALVGSRNGCGDVEVQTALHQLLESSDWWQRRLAAEIGLRRFGKDDSCRLNTRLKEETHDEVKVWLNLTLARITEDLDSLANAFEQDPEGFIEAQRRILHSEDYAAMKKTIIQELPQESDKWKKSLGLHVLRHMGVWAENELDENLAWELNKYPYINYLRSQIKERDIDTVIRLFESNNQKGIRLLAINMLQNVKNDERVLLFLLKQWQKHSEYDVRNQLMWRLLDYSDLEIQVYESIYNFVMGNWDKWLMNQIRWAGGPDNVLGTFENRMNDTTFPESKHWAYLCACMGSPDKESVKNLLLRYAESSVSINAKVAKDLLEKVDLILGNNDMNQ
jgi:general nucleoside transport system ATP-binding protein